MAKFNTRLMSWCVVGISAGGILSRDEWHLRQSPVQSTSMPSAMGITAALWQQKQGARLLDLRPLSVHDLPIPNSFKILPSDTTQPLIVIGDAQAVARVSQTHRVVGHVAPWTLRRDTHIAPAWEISTAQSEVRLKHNLRILDLREEHEFRDSHIPRSTRVSMFEVASAIGKSERVALFCETGHRSAFVVKQLRARGWNHVLSVRGGLLDWKHEKRSLIGDDENGR